MKLDALCPRPTFIPEDDEDSVKELVEEVKKAQDRGIVVAVDTETTGLDKQKDRVVVWSICYEARSRYVLSFISLYEFKPLFNNPEYKWVFTNAKYDLSVLANSGVEVAGKIYDTIIMDWLMDPDKANIHDLKYSSKRHLGIEMREFKDVFPASEDQGSAVLRTIYEGTEHEIDQAIDYAAMDAWATFKLHQFYKCSLEKTDAWKFIEGIYVPLVKVLWRMERRGVKIDVERLKALKAPLIRENNEIEREINKITGKVVNPRSTKQLIELLIDNLNLPVIKMTSGGSSGIKKPSVDGSCLKEWAKTNKIAEKILRHRNNTKIIRTYVDGILKRLSDDGRIHTTFNAHITSTGRLSSSGPNLQNIPARSEVGAEIRACFIPEEDKVMIVLDYSQVEMMIAAHMSSDPGMISAIREGRDLHSATASIMFNAPYELIVEAKKAKDSGNLTKDQEKYIEMRTHSKTIGFGLLYGMGAPSLMEDLNVGQDKAEALIEKFFSRFPAIREFINKQKSQALNKFEVRTILGRPRYMHGAKSRDYATKSRALRAAVNTPIQGSAADIINKAMVAIEDDPRLKELGCGMLLQVHDELIFECPPENANEAAEIIKGRMETPGIQLKVPLSADPGFGLNWTEAK